MMCSAMAVFAAEGIRVFAAVVLLVLGLLDGEVEGLSEDSEWDRFISDGMVVSRMPWSLEERSGSNDWKESVG